MSGVQAHMAAKQSHGAAASAQRPRGAPGTPAAATTEPPVDLAVNIASHLPRMAELHPNRPAIVCALGGRDAAGHGRYASWTFAELDRESNRLANGLERIGVTRGTRTILMVRPSLDFFALVFALFKVGAVPVVIDPGMGRDRMVDCLAGARAEAFIGIPIAQVLRLLHRRAFATVRNVITVGRRWCWGGATLDDLRRGASDAYEVAGTRADEVAAILFTSGSTGPSKGVVYEHGMFDAQVRLLKATYGMQPGEVDLATFPLFALFDPALGMTCVVPRMDFTRPAQADPESIIRTIQEQRCTNMFASPALLDRVARHGVARGVKLQTLQRAVSAGAPVRPAILERFARLLPAGAEVFTPYGATEALPVASIGSAEIIGETAEATARGAGVCVGRPVDEMKVRVIGITEEPIESWSDELALPPMQVGEIAVSGPVVTREYFGQPEATRRAKIGHDCCAADADRRGFFHRMGDVGYLDESGRLWMCGRKAHRVETAEGVLFTVPCEGVFNQHPKVLRTALVGVKRRPSGDSAGKIDGWAEPVLCVELEPGVSRSERDRIRRELLELGARHEHTRGIGVILFQPGFPVDVRHNAKIFREKLALWAARRL